MLGPRHRGCPLSRLLNRVQTAAATRSSRRNVGAADRAAHAASGVSRLERDVYPAVFEALEAALSDSDVGGRAAASTHHEKIRSATMR